MRLDSGAVGWTCIENFGIMPTPLVNEIPSVIQASIVDSNLVVCRTKCYAGSRWAESGRQYNIGSFLIDARETMICRARGLHLTACRIFSVHWQRLSSSIFHYTAAETRRPMYMTARLMFGDSELLNVRTVTWTSSRLYDSRHLDDCATTPFGTLMVS